MCNTRPVLRIGQTLDFRAEFDDGEPPEIWLRGADAREVAYALHQDLRAVADQISDAMVNNGKIVVKERRKGRSDDGRLTLDRGLIIDLPNMVFETDRYLHRVRLCLTICQPGLKSKLWFRTQCDKVRNKKRNFAAHVEFSLDELDHFFSEGTQLATFALDKLREVYNQRIGDKLGSKKAGMKTELAIDREFHFKLFDSDRPDLKVMFDELDDGNSFSDTLESYVRKNENRPHPAMLAAQLQLEEDLTSAEAIKAIRNEDHGFTIFGHRNERQEPGLFIRSGHADHGVITYSGVAYDADAAAKTKKPQHSPAFSLTARMLASVVRDDAMSGV